MKNLFVVGAQRSGSTYLYNVLNNHPQITMAEPVRPEPKFFLDDDLYAKGRTYYEDKYFTSCSAGTQYYGEKSTSYIESLEAARRIWSFYPDARVILILRDPVQRAWSNYCFSVQHGMETLDFKSALAMESERIENTSFSSSVSPFAYRSRGDYINYINDYLSVFPPDQLRVLIFEEFVGEIQEVHKLYRWLGVDDAIEPASLSEVVNPTSSSPPHPKPVLRELAKGFSSSLDRLEAYLSRPVNCWRKAWDEM